MIRLSEGRLGERRKVDMPMITGCSDTTGIYDLNVKAFGRIMEKLPKYFEMFSMKEKALLMI